MFKEKKSPSGNSTTHKEHNNEDVRVNAPKEPSDRRKKLKIIAKYAIKFLILKLLGWLIVQLKRAWDWLCNHVEEILEAIS